MTTTETPLMSGCDILTHSRRQAYMACPRMHYYRYELGIRRDFTEKPLRFGAAVHVGLERMAKGDAIDVAIDKATASYRQMPAWAQTESDLYDWQIEGVEVACLLVGYEWYYRNFPIEFESAEEVFNLPIINPDTGYPMRTFRQGGKFDGIGVYQGERTVIEHKTTSYEIEDDGADYWKKLRMDSQCNAYMLAAMEKAEVRAVLYDVIRKPTIKPKHVPVLDADGYKVVVDENGERVYLKNGKLRQSADTAKGYKLDSRMESPDEYRDRLMDDILDRPCRYYQRQIVYRTDAELVEYRHELYDIAQTIAAARRDNRHPRNTSSCIGFGKCAYFDICPDFDMTNPRVPDGFVQVEDVHPELSEDQ